MNESYQNYSYYRTLRGKSDYQVSQETGISRSTLSDWKNNRHEPLTKTLYKIAENLGVDINAFYEKPQKHSSSEQFAEMFKKNLESSAAMAGRTKEAIDKMFETTLAGYTIRLLSGEEVTLSIEEFKELRSAVEAYVDSWVRSKRNLI